MPAGLVSLNLKPVWVWCLQFVCRWHWTGFGWYPILSINGLLVKRFSEFAQYLKTSCLFVKTWIKSPQPSPSVYFSFNCHLRNTMPLYGKIVHAIFYKQHFRKNSQLTNQAKAKQHPKANLLLFENFSLSSSTLSSKNK